MVVLVCIRRCTSQICKYVLEECLFALSSACLSISAPDCLCVCLVHLCMSIGEFVTFLSLGVSRSEFVSITLCGLACIGVNQRVAVCVCVFECVCFCVCMW